jgi:transposase InsO family protein
MGKAKARLALPKRDPVITPDPQFPKPKQVRFDGVPSHKCYNCGSPGHFKRDCRKPKALSPVTRRGMADEDDDGDVVYSDDDSDGVWQENTEEAIGDDEGDDALPVRKAGVMPTSQGLVDALDGQLAYFKDDGVAELDGQLFPDGGSSVNQISHVVVEKLGRARDVEKLPHPLKVILADGTHTSFTSVLRKVPLSMRVGRVVYTAQLAAVVIDDPSISIVLGRPILQLWQLDPESVAGQLATMRSLQAQSGAWEQRMDDYTRDEDPIEPAIGEDEGIGLFPTSYAEDDALIISILEDKLLEAKSKGLTRLREILLKHVDIFRVTVRPDPPVKCTPLKVRVKSGVKPVRMPPLRYQEQELAFLKDLVSQLTQAGYLRPVPVAHWATNGRVVPKSEKGSSGFRLVGGYRACNSQLEHLVGPMPYLENLLSHLTGMQYFCVLDCFKGFWALPLDPSCWEIFCLQLGELGLFLPTRVPQGTTAAACFYQAIMRDCLGDLLYKVVISWIDDLLLYAASQDLLLEAIALVLARLEELGFKLAVKKATFFSTEVIWCGHQISARGISPDPSKVQGLPEAAKPQTLADLQYFVCAASWMRKHIPEFAAIFRPLQELVTNFKGSKAQKRTAQLGSLWTAQVSEAYDSCISALVQSVTLAHPDSKCQRCAFTDASDHHWAVVITQVPQDLAKSPPEEGNHQPLAFYSGTFTGSSKDWSTADKEGYAIMQVWRKGSFLALGHEVHIYTDHRNFAYIFAGSGRLAAHSARLKRWASELSGYDFILHHIPGPRNVWADLLSRNLGPAPLTVRKCVGLARLNKVMDDPSPVSVAVSPDMESVRALVVAHQGLSGHRGVKATVTNLKRAGFVWPNMDQRVTAFIQQCLSCVDSQGVIQVKQLGSQQHASRPGELLHLDYLDMGEMSGDIEALLVLVDDFSKFVWLHPAKAKTAAVAASTLLSYSSVVGLPSLLLSDGGSHFTASIISELTRLTSMDHHVTTAYNPRSNGTVERLNREVLKVFRALLSEFRMSTADWALLVPVVQYSLNWTSTPLLAGHTPAEVCFGSSGGRPLDVFLRPTTKSFSMERVSSTQLEAHVSTLRVALSELHREVLSTRTSRIQPSLPRKSFELGEFVLWARPQRTKKLRHLWIGPYRIRAVLSPWVYEIEHLVSGVLKRAHLSRLRFYADEAFEVTVSLKDHLVFNEGEFEVDHISHIWMDADGIYAKVHWVGFEDEEASYEDLLKIFPSCSRLCLRALHDSSITAVAVRKRALLELQLLGFR